MIRTLLHELGVPLSERVRWNSRLLSAVDLPALAAALNPLSQGMVWLDSADYTHPTGVAGFLATDLGSGESSIISAAMLDTRLENLEAAEIIGGGAYQPGVFWSLTYEADQVIYLLPDVMIHHSPDETWPYAREGTDSPI